MEFKPKYISLFLQTAWFSVQMFVSGLVFAAFSYLDVTLRSPVLAPPCFLVFSLRPSQAEHKQAHELDKQGHIRFCAALSGGKSAKTEHLQIKCLLHKPCLCPHVHCERALR